MPLKFCSVNGPDCERQFFSRWRNVPAICPPCALHVVVCPGCRAPKLRGDDPAQLALFTVADMERRGTWSTLDALLQNHFANRAPPRIDEELPPWPVAASPAVRRASPYF